MPLLKAKIIKHTATLLCFFVLTGCGTTGLNSESGKTGYILVSEGKAGFVQRIFGADVHYCKATQHNMTGVVFVGEITFTEETCRVGITAESRAD